MPGDPHYACAALSDRRGWWLLQLRPLDHVLAGGQLTCFGGRREEYENAETCVRRELHEELQWCPTILTPALELWQGPTYLACFFRGTLNVPVSALRTEPRHLAVLVPVAALGGLPISLWHAAALLGIQRGDRHVEVSGSQ